ncbi:MAG: B12-binding domain-containing radical SAM protein [Dorea sp.]
MEYEVLLINVFRDTSGYSESFNDSIGQYLIAGYLRERDFVAQVYSGNSLDCKKIIENEVLHHNVHIVGFYAAADNIRIVAHAIQWIKKNYPEVITFVGGPQAIALDTAFFLSTGNDYAIVGEGEIPTYKLLSHLIDGSGKIEDIPSLLYYDCKAKVMVWNQCDDAIVSNLDEIPFPHIEDSLSGKLRQGKMVGIITGRGCPNHCTFCYEGASAKNVRFRSIGNVMEEIDYITAHNPQVEYINIYDDTFTLQPDRILEFCKAMKQRNLKWFCEGHVSFVIQHPEILKIMVESGLTCIQFGIESGSQTVLDAYNKHTNSDMILECVKICKDMGLHGVTGNFIVGGAFETEQTILESKELAAKLINSAKGIIEIYVVYFAPYPNTQMVKFPEQFGISINPQLEEWNLNTMRSPVVRTDKLDTLEIYKQKHYFESFLSECYHIASLQSTKNDVLMSLFQDGKRIHINPTWEKCYQSFNHIDVFLRHLTEQEQTFSDSGYIIRTFEDFVIDEEKMCTEVGTFMGAERDILLNATGIYSVTEMSNKLSVSIDRMREIFESLNKRCLVYMSGW